MTIETAASPAPQPEPKRSGRRALKLILVVLLLVIVIGLILLYLNLNRIVRSTVESQSSASLNVPTKLQSAQVSLLGGSVKLNDFDIGSPAGFKADQMMSLGAVNVDVSLGELRQDPIKISSIDLQSPKMIIEMQGTGFNIKKFVDQLPPTEPQAEPIKMVIGQLNVSGAQVIFRPDVAAMSSLPGIGEALGGLKQEYVLSIPPLKLENIGTGEGSENGAAIKEVVSLLVTELAAKAAQSEQLPPEIRQILSLNVNDLAGSLKQKLGEEAQKQLGKIATDVTKDLSPEAAKAVEGVLKDPRTAATNPAAAIEQGLGGLLGGRKKPATQPATQPAR
jgi:cell division protein FtsB